jgi:hypothetical protein
MHLKLAARQESLEAAGPIWMTLDEYGAGAPQLSLANRPAVRQFLPPPPPPPFPAGYSVATDPISGIVTLRYTLMHGGQTPGDLYLTELDSGAISDIIRFDGQGNVFFFSLKKPGQTSFSLADVDTLPALSANNLGHVEVAGEHNIGNVLYPSALSQPGYDPLYNGTLAYNIISDVPERNISAFTTLFGLALWYRSLKSKPPN